MLIMTGSHSILVNDLGNLEKENNRLLNTKRSQKIDDKYLLLTVMIKDAIKLENRPNLGYVRSQCFVSSQANVRLKSLKRFQQMPQF